MFHIEPLLYLVVGRNEIVWEATKTRSCLVLSWFISCCVVLFCVVLCCVVWTAKVKYLCKKDIRLSFGGDCWFVAPLANDSPIWQVNVLLFWNEDLWTAEALCNLQEQAVTYNGNSEMQATQCIEMDQRITQLCCSCYPLWVFGAKVHSPGKSRRKGWTLHDNANRSSDGNNTRQRKSYRPSSSILWCCLTNILEQTSQRGACCFAQCFKHNTPFPCKRASCFFPESESKTPEVPSSRQKGQKKQSTCQARPDICTRGLWVIDFVQRAQLWCGAFSGAWCGQ